MMSQISKRSLAVKADTVKMQVNKYFHPTQIIPINLTSAQALELL